VTFLFIYIYGESRGYFGSLTEYSGIDVAILFRPSGSDVSAVSARYCSFSRSGHRPRIAPQGSAFLALETLLKRAQSGLQPPPQLPPEADNTAHQKQRKDRCYLKQELNHVDCGPISVTEIASHRERDHRKYRPDPALPQIRSDRYAYDFANETRPKKQ